VVAILGPGGSDLVPELGMSLRDLPALVVDRLRWCTMEQQRLVEDRSGN
jgi:hypothetical protein